MAVVDVFVALSYGIKCQQPVSAKLLEHNTNTRHRRIEKVTFLDIYIMCTALYNLNREHVCDDIQELYRLS